MAEVNWINLFLKAATFWNKAGLKKIFHLKSKK